MAGLINVIQSLGLTSGLKLCLDTGDANSYSGSGQSWLDTSGNGYDFFRGATGSAAGDDPTFNGTAGRLSSTEYWSSDGGDFFRYHTTNETWMQNLHKAGAKFTLMQWIYPYNSGTHPGFWGGVTSTSHVGGSWYSDTRQIWTVTNGSGIVINPAGSVNVAQGVWQLLAVSLDASIGANGGLFFNNGTVDLFNSTYSSPSSSNATYTLEIGSQGNGSAPMENTSRLGMFAAWEGVALTQAQLNAIYLETLPRFGPGHIITAPSLRMQAVQRAAVR